MGVYVKNLAELNSKDLPHVGGKNASLGEMIQNLSSVGVSVPGGFATTSQAFQLFLSENNLKDEIDQSLDALDVDDIGALKKCGEKIRNLILQANLPDQIEQDIRQAYTKLEEQVSKNIAARLVKTMGLF